MTATKYEMPARLLRRNVAILAGGEALTRAVTLVIFVYLARIFEPEVYGLLELTLAVMMFLTIAVEQGFGTLGTREVARNTTNIESLTRQIVSAQLLMAAAIFTLVVLVALLLPFGTAFSLLLIGYSASLLAKPFMLNWFFQGRDRMGWIALPQFLRYATFAAIVMWIVTSPEEFLLLPVAELAAVTVAATVNLVGFWRAGKRLMIDLGAGWDRRLFVESLPIGGSQMVWALRMYFPIILLGIMKGEAAAGGFGASHRIMMVFQTALTLYFTGLFPTMSRASNSSTGALEDILYRSLRLLIWPSILLALVLALSARPLVGLIFGGQFALANSAAVLSVLIWLIPVLACRGHFRNALISLGLQREEFSCSLAGVVIQILLTLPLTYRYGAPGTAAAMLLSEIWATMLTWRVLKRNVPNLRMTQNLIGASLTTR